MPSVASAGTATDLLNTPEEAYSRARIYLTIMFTGTIFSFGYNLVSAILRGMGDSKHPFVFVAIASLTNLVLDYIFIAIFGWDVAGAAVATIMSQALSFIISAMSNVCCKPPPGVSSKSMIP